MGYLKGARSKGSRAARTRIRARGRPAARARVGSRRYAALMPRWLFPVVGFVVGCFTLVAAGRLREVEPWGPIVIIGCLIMAGLWLALAIRVE